MPLPREKLVAWITEHAPVDAASLADDTKLFSSSLIDSFVMVDLLLFLEEQMGVPMPTGDVNLDNLDTIGSILAYAARRGR
jgi:acyl carrier protein